MYLLATVAKLTEEHDRETSVKDLLEPIKKENNLPEKNRIEERPKLNSLKTEESSCSRDKFQQEHSIQTSNDPLYHTERYNKVELLRQTYNLTTEESLTSGVCKDNYAKNTSNNLNVTISESDATVEVSLETDDLELKSTDSNLEISSNEEEASMPHRLSRLDKNTNGKLIYQIFQFLKSLFDRYYNMFLDLFFK